MGSDRRHVRWEIGDPGWTDLGYLKDGSVALTIRVIQKLQPPDVLVRRIFLPLIEEDGRVRLCHKASPDVEKGVRRIHGPLPLILFRSKVRHPLDRVRDEASQKSPASILRQIVISTQVEPNSVRVHVKNLLKVAGWIHRQQQFTSGIPGRCSAETSQPYSIRTALAARH